MLNVVGLDLTMLNKLTSRLEKVLVLTNDGLCLISGSLSQ
jgi:hypothetical protein